MFTAEYALLFYLLLFAVAFFYASVGHGGASGYLAVMALFGFAQEVMKPTALMLNLFVSLTAFIHFYRKGYFAGKIFLPLALASIPLSFLGGRIPLDDNLYRKILGVLLLVSVMRFLVAGSAAGGQLKKPVIVWLVIIGGCIGLLSGMIGIGGGIILSPVLLLLRWTDLKQTAAISALFIFVNSLGGLAGQLTRGIAFSGDMYAFVMVAFAGGLCGSWLGATRFSIRGMKFVLSAVLLAAAAKLIWL